nr:hypothetical protein [Elusimicrobiota bacterium]
MKQILSVGLIAVMVFSVYGCGGSNQESSKEGNSSVKSAKETTKSSKVKSSGKVTEDVYID